MSILSKITVLLADAHNVFDNSAIPNKPGNGDASAVADSLLSDVMSTVFYVLGFVCVGGIIYGAVVYTTSAGNPEKVKKAKNAILYSIVGLIVAVLAFTIVNFVVGSVA